MPYAGYKSPYRLQDWERELIDKALGNLPSTPELPADFNLSQYRAITEKGLSDAMNSQWLMGQALQDRARSDKELDQYEEDQRQLGLAREQEIMREQGAESELGRDIRKLGAAASLKARTEPVKGPGDVELSKSDAQIKAAIDDVLNQFGPKTATPSGAQYSGTLKDKHGNILFTQGPQTTTPKTDPFKRLHRDIQTDVNQETTADKLGVNKESLLGKTIGGIGSSFGDEITPFAKVGAKAFNKGLESLGPFMLLKLLSEKKDVNDISWEDIANVLSGQFIPGGLPNMINAAGKTGQKLRSGQSIQDLIKQRLGY